MHLASQRVSDRSKVGALYPQQVPGINADPVEQGQLHQQLRADIPGVPGWLA